MYAGSTICTHSRASHALAWGDVSRVYKRFINVPEWISLCCKCMQENVGRVHVLCVGVAKVISIILYTSYLRLCPDNIRQNVRGEHERSVITIGNAMPPSFYVKILCNLVILDIQCLK